MVFSYKLSHDKSISDELKIRHQEQVSTLENEDFELFSLHQEIIWPFSVIILFPVYLTMVGNEFIQIESPLRISTYQLMFVSNPYATYAYVYGMGCKFYTNFTDGTWLVSNTGQRVRDAKIIVLARDYKTITTEKLWERHQSKISELQAEGKLLNKQMSFDKWVEVENRFDKGNLVSIISAGVIWLAFLSWVIYWLVGKI